MASIAEVDSITMHDEREAMLSSRLASLNIPDIAVGSPGRRTRNTSSPEPYALSATMQAALQVAESKKLEQDLRRREQALDRASNGNGGGLTGENNTRALTEKTVELSSRLREREEVAESLRERERVLEQKLREKRSAEAALMRRVDQLQNRVMEVEAESSKHAERASNLEHQLTTSLEEQSRIAAAHKAATGRVRKLEFQTKQQDEQVKALANRVKQESMDKASRWKEYSVVEKGMQRRLQEKEAEEFRLQEKLRGVEVKLEMQNVKLSEMVAREQALLSQVEEYRAAEQHMADGVRGAEVRSKALADSLVEKESTEEELLEKLRQMEMRNGTLQLLLERSEKLHSTLKESETRLKQELHERAEAEAAAQHQVTVLDTERRLRGRQVDDLRKQVEQLEVAAADHEEVVASLRGAKSALEGELSTEAARSSSLASRVADLEAALTSKDDELQALRATIDNEARRATDAETALVRAERSQVSVVEKEKRLMDEVKAAQLAALASKKRSEALRVQIEELKQSEAELATGLNTLGAALNAKDKTIESLEAELRRTRSTASESSEALTMKAAVVSELNTKLQGSMSRHKTLQALLWRQEKVEAALKEREKLLESQLAESRAAADVLTQNVRELTARVREIQDNEAKLEEHDHAQRAELERAARTKAQLTAKLDTARASLADKELAEAGLRERVAQLESAAVEAEATTDTLRRDVATWQDRAAEAEERVAQLEADAVELAERLMRHDKDANKARATLWRSQQAETTLTTRAQVQAKQLTDAKNRCVDLAAQAEGLHLQLVRTQEESARAHAEASMQLDKAQATNSELMSALKQRERTEAVLSSQIEELNGTIRRQEQDMLVLTQRTGTLEASLADKEKAEATLLANVDKMDKELTSVLRQRAALEARLARATAELADHTARSDDLEAKHEELQATLKAKVHSEAVLAERARHLEKKLADAASQHSELRVRMDKLASPRPSSIRALTNVASAADAFADGAASKAPGTPRKVAAPSRDPGSPSTGSSAPRAGGLFHLAYSHPSLTTKRYAVYRSIFDAVDTDRSGSISLQELKAYIETTATRIGYLQAKRRQAGALSRALEPGALLGVSGITEAGGSAEHKDVGGTGGAAVPGTPRTRARHQAVVDAHTRSRFCRFFTAGRGSLDATFTRYDTDGNGTISWEEFKVLADEVFLPRGLPSALAAEEERGVRAQQKQAKLESPEADENLALWRREEQKRRHRVLAEELDRQNQRLLDAARTGQLGDHVFGAATPMKGIGGQRSSPPSAVPRMQLLDAAGSDDGSAAGGSTGEYSSAMTMSSPAPAGRIAATASAAAGASFASPRGHGFGETEFLSSSPASLPSPQPSTPRSARGNATMDASGTLTVPMLAGSKPLVISPTPSPRGGSVPTPTRGAGGLQLPQLPASVAKYLSPAAMKHVQVSPQGQTPPAAAAAVVPTDDVDTVVSDTASDAVSDATPTAGFTPEDEHEELMAALDAREKEVEDSLGVMEESFASMHALDAEIREKLRQAQAATAAAAPSDA